MPAIVGAHHTSFTVADIERSLKFFRDGLGLEVVFTREVRDDYFGQIVGLPGAVVKAALLRIPNSTHHVELFQYLAPVGETKVAKPCDPGSCHLALLVDDLPSLYDALQDFDVSFASEPVEITAGPNSGALALYLRDPNGIMVELFQPVKRKPS